MADIDTAALRAQFKSGWFEGHTDESCWCRGTHAEGTHSSYERDRAVVRAADEIDALRARLAEVEAERDAAIAGSREIRGTLLETEARLAEVEAELSEERDRAAEGWERAEAAEVRLAAVEAERDRRTSASYWPGITAENADLRARLAAVLALCDEEDPEMTFPEWQNKVRAAAARGEGDQAAEHYDTEDAHGNPVCVCPDINGEGDR